MNYKVGSIPFDYLRLKVGANMKLAKNWRSVIDSFEARLSNMEGKTHIHWWKSDSYSSGSGQSHGLLLLSIKGSG